MRCPFPLPQSPNRRVRFGFNQLRNESLSVIFIIGD